MRQPCRTLAPNFRDPVRPSSCKRCRDSPHGPRGVGHERLGDPRRSGARLSQRGYAPQGHYDRRLSGASEAFRRTRACEDRQSVALLQLPVEGLLRLATRGSARPSGDPDGRDNARSARAEAIRAVAAGIAGGADRRRDQGARERGYNLRPSVLLRLRPGSAFRGLRPALVRLVPLPGDRSHHHARQTLEDRSAARPAARQARAGRDGILSHEPAPAHPARLAEPARTADRALFPGRVARSAG